MAGPTITQISHGLYRRREMARRLKCSEHTVATFTAAYKATSRVELSILTSRYERRETARS